MPEPIRMQKGQLVLRNPRTGDMRSVPTADADRIAADEGLDFPTPDEITAANEQQQYGGAGEGLKAAAGLAARTASFGLTGAPDTAQQARERVLRSSNLGQAASFGAQALGTAVPGVLGGGVGGAAAEALGLGARGAALAGAVGEGAASGLADEVEQARAEGRDVSAGNVALFGVGAELFGRAVPALLGRGASRLRRALTPADALVEGESVLGKAEMKAAARASNDVADIPLGPDRDEFVARSADSHYERLATESRTAFNSADKAFRDLGDVSKKPERVAHLVPETAPVQARWANEAAHDATRTADDLVRGPVPRETLDLPGGMLDDADAGAAAAYEGGIPLPQSPGVKSYATKIAKDLRAGADLMQGADDSVGWFIAGDQTKRAAQKRIVELGSAIRRQGVALDDQVALKGLRDRLVEFEGGLRSGLEDESRFGNAALYQQDVNRAWVKYLEGVEYVDGKLSTTLRKRGGFIDTRPERTYDPAKILSMLQQDKEVGRQVFDEQLDKVARGMEDMAAAHKKWGTADDAQIAGLEKDVRTIRDSIAGADDVQASTKRFQQRQEYEKTVRENERASERARKATEEPAVAAPPDALGTVLGVAGMVPGLGGIVRMGRLVAGFGAAGKAIASRSARLAVRGFGTIEEGLARLPRAAVPLTATALERFTGDYPDAHTSFAAKKQVLQAMQKDPEVLLRALGDAFHDLSDLNPRLHADLSARYVRSASYLAQNLPAGVSVSMVYPDGYPPSTSAVRDFAVLWNSVLEPDTVFDDVAVGAAEPAQLDALEAVHPDLYADLQNSVLQEVSESYEDIPVQTKIWLDILFKGDGLAGALYSTRAAGYIDQARQAEAEQAQQQNPELDLGTPGETAGQPRGIAAIKTGVSAPS